MSAVDRTSDATGFTKIMAYKTVQPHGSGANDEGHATHRAPQCPVKSGYQYPPPAQITAGPL
eukprot:CAMPEP_0174341252 /NCGR_PEP_ID=MMETSP0810-20121108/25278_1 /TAXON_ID=73025 ORGANISM="Eutreptiella gymnastica-like, Strain CCMP1594" /NCGR_SAMPLE_ID=MMETSP0810 /ASSEMBLY_ACC=CAM_ASM_000659 /LENGTH=61 /DNA_ID=CAMNT_0015462807 /DNA_START=121 /DNA_END=307 /DNA_ORIENTATION=+